MISLAPKIEVWIRTFEERSILAKRLSHRIYTHFQVEARILDCGIAEHTYSEKFIYLMSSIIDSCNSRYVLILEDDMVFSRGANERVLAAADLELPCVWYSILGEDLLEKTQVFTENCRVLWDFERLHYSGAILIQRTLLQHFLENYLLSYQELEFRNFDIAISEFLKSRRGFIHLEPSVFATDPSIASALSHASFKVPGRVNTCRSALDPHFDFNTVFT